MRVDLRPRFPSVPWHTSYLVVAALNTGLVVGLWYAFPRVRESTGLVPVGFVVGTFTVVSLLHWYDATGDRTPERR